MSFSLHLIRANSLLGATTANWLARTRIRTACLSRHRAGLGSLQPMVVSLDSMAWLVGAIAAAAAALPTWAAVMTLGLCSPPARRWAAAAAAPIIAGWWLLCAGAATAVRAVFVGAP